ncbi:MAG: hypothetical protein H0V89_08280 [Deltaproteobacteria bacterium]|nr:hypothetical protein [Deltaproteobacteria bacterium]
MNEVVASKVGPPGIALALFGLGSIATHLMLGLIVLVGAFPTVLALLGGESESAEVQTFLATTGWQILWLAIGFFTSFLVTFAGLRLRSARSPALVYVGAVSAMLPCVSCCCVLGLPIGIWVLVVMQDGQVKAAFAERF